MSTLFKQNFCRVRELEKNGQHAACHQTGRAGPAPPTATVSPVSHCITVSLCDLCEFTSISKHGVSVHVGNSYRKLSNSEALESSHRHNDSIEKIDGNIKVEGKTTPL